MTKTAPDHPANADRAFQAAVAIVERFRDRLALGSPYLKDVLRELLRGMCVSASGKLKVSGMRKVIGYARQGDEFSADVLREVFSDILESGAPMPPCLRTYFKDTGNSPPKGRGKKKIDYFQRDDIIAGLVGDLADAFQIPATRNRAATRESASSIVARALSVTKVAPMGEKAVEAICTRVRAEKRAWAPLIRAQGILK